MRTVRTVETRFCRASNPTPASTSEFKAAKAAHGSMKYGPFDVNGNNKQGFYLSELHEQLATIFIDAAIAANPTDTTLLTIKNNI